MMKKSSPNVGMSSKRLLLVVFGLLTVLLPLWFSASGRAWVVTMPGAEEWARGLVASGRPAQDCLKLHTIFPSYPQVGELQSYCIRTYAALAKDPSACELLMPSRAGLDCVGGAIKSPICGINHGIVVQWHEGDEILYASPAECAEQEQSAKGESCCYLAQVYSVKTMNDCSRFMSQSEFHDECQMNVAFKNHDPTSCESIQNPTLKTACTIQAKALKQVPSICQGCTKPVESVEELLELQP